MDCHDCPVCPVCHKTLTLAAQLVKCKCGQAFCVAHRRSTAHACPFDYHREFQMELERRLRPCIAEKVIHI